MHEYKEDGSSHMTAGKRKRLQTVFFLINSCKYRGLYIELTNIELQFKEIKSDIKKRKIIRSKIEEERKEEYRGELESTCIKSNETIK